jgi:glycosyltransferase involved in cell wall biosynthesis
LLLDYFKIANRKKRALVSYVTKPLRFKLPFNNSKVYNFSNAGIAINIVRALKDLNYAVDVIDWDDESFVPTKHYDLFIGHGGCNFERIAHHLSSDTVKIYFATGMYWKKSNEAEEERLKSFEKRHDIRLSYERKVIYSEEYANRTADGIICLGNQTIKDSFSGFPLLINLNIAAYSDNRYEAVKKDFAFSKDKFLFFSGQGSVHKGLDLLLEAFSGADAHLYICHAVRQEFFKIYKHELNNLPNIHFIGGISLRSEKFYNLIDTCAFIIHPSCAEGQPGSVIDCMHQGLIPVVSRETGIDVDDFGIELKSCSVEEIIKIVRDLSQRSSEWCEEMSRRTRKAAIAKFSEKVFLHNMKEAIQHIIAQKSKEMSYG